MKIGIYTDVHCSVTSSILPLYSSGSKYTTRLNMIIDTYRWMYSVFLDNKVNIILNGGDTCDKNVLRSEEITALAEAYCFSNNITEYTILGNHEILDVSRSYSSIELTNNYPFINLIKDPVSTSFYDRGQNITIGFLPYMKAEDVTPDVLSKIRGNILLSHIDIRGSHLRTDYTAETGVDPELLANYFDFVSNGHIHTRETIPTSKGLVMNIGSCTSNSFSDDNNYIPSICIYDTRTNKLQTFENPHAILFRRITTDTVSNVIKRVNEYLSKGFKYAFRINVPYNIADDVRDYMESLLKDKVVAYRVVGDVSKMKARPAMFSIGKIDGATDTSLEFKKYLRSGDTPLSHPIEDYIQFVDSLD